MNDLFLKYMEDRFKSRQSHIRPTSFSKAGPVITISRMFGCSANSFAKELQDAIHSIQEDSSSVKKWNVLNKEIINESAKELGLEPKQIKYVFDSEKKSTINNILDSMLVKYYKNERFIRKTIIEVVKDYAYQGNNILVGRAGVAISQDIESSLHIRLVAPEKWRAAYIANKYNYTKKEALFLVREMDEKRKKLIESFYELDVKDDLFDVVFNIARVPMQNAIQSCLILLKCKNMI